jgi:hypothetical protein
MILKKVQIDGKDAFVPINIEEAKLLAKQGIDLTFTNEDEKEDFYDDLEEDEEEEDYDDSSEDMKEDVSANPNSKIAKLMKVLPFLEEEDLSDFIKEVLSGKESLKDINIMAFLPFLSEEDCDKLFLKAIHDGNTRYKASSIAPFVSEEVLSVIVDQYLEGKLPQEQRMDSLYPFLSSADVKRVFQHLLQQKDDTK